MLRCLCALAWVFLVTVTAAHAERLPISTYTVEDGLAHARVRRIVRDPRGFLWFCTIDGLSRFDGAEFVTYRTADGLPDPWVTDLLTTRDGAYWVATNGGVALFDGTRRVSQDGGRRAEERPRQSFNPVAFEGSPTQRQVRVLLEDRAGRVWAGGRGGLYLLDRSGSALTFRPVVPSPAALVTSLVEGVDGGMWIGTLDGLFHRLASGGVVPEPTAARAGIRNIRALSLDDDGRLWVGHDAGLLVLGPGAAGPRLASSTTHPLRECGAGPSRQRRLRLPTGSEDACTMTMDDGLIDKRVRALAVGSNGHVRVGTVAGVSDIDGAQITSIGEAQGLVPDAINTLNEDRDGNLWIGTDTSGAVRIAAFGLVSYFVADGLRHDYIQSLIEGDSGRLIAVSGYRFTINEFDGRRFVSARFNVPPDVPDNRYSGVLRDHQGAWWLGTAIGLYRFPPVRRIADLGRVPPEAHYARLPALPSDDLFPLFEDARGDIWLIAQLSDHVRLLRWRRSTNDFQTYGSSEGLAEITSPPAISRPAIVEAPAGQLFFGFREAGLFAYRDGRFEAILDDGEPFGVVSLHIDRLGRLWIIGVDGSVRRIDNPSTRSLVNDTTVAPSLVGANVRCMVEDASGNLYFGTTSGIIEVDPRTGDTRRYTTAEGLAKNEVWSALASRRGDIWFATIAGVSRLDATRARPRTPAPPALITTVYVNGVARLVSELGDREVSELTLAPSERGVAIGFFALTFASGEHLRYQYRLEGAETDWSPPSTERVVHFSQLAPGRYRFQVRAVTSAGLAGVTPAAMDFVILPPVWQRWWFRSAVVVGLTLLVFVGHRYRVARLLETERVRTRIASDLHDDIGSSLSQIAILSEVARTSSGDDARVAAPLDRIATLSRESVDAMGDIVWAIDPHRDTPTHLTQRLRRLANDLLSARGIEVRFETSDASHPRLGADVRREVFLIFKEALHNITRHAQATRVEIALSIAQHRLELVVQDDGCGFDSARARDGQGLRNMVRRAQGLGGTLAVTSADGTGARLVLNVPL